MDERYIIDKHGVRSAFERAAASYDQAAILQREVGDRMLSRLDYIKYHPDIILDAGSGTGHGTRKLLTRYPDARILAVDLALAMHIQATPPLPWWRRLGGRSSWQVAHVVADIEQLPCRNACAGLVWSNLALQWCNDVRATFAEVRRVLRTGGLFMFSTFGPDTLKELREAFRSADGFSHVNRFPDMHDIGDMLVHSGFATPVMDMEYITMTYDDAVSLMRDLKAIGAHNVTRGRRRGLTGKKTWKSILSHYETLRSEGKLPATFEVVYGHAWKPEPRTSVLTPETRRQLGLE